MREGVVDCWNVFLKSSSICFSSSSLIVNRSSTEGSVVGDAEDCRLLPVSLCLFESVEVSMWVGGTSGRLLISIWLLGSVGGGCSFAEVAVLLLIPSVPMLHARFIFPSISKSL